MTEREALLHAIRLEPHEDTPRLVYADWLDEHGDAADRAHAEQIRVQIEFSAHRIELPWRHPTIAGITGSVSRGFVAQLELTVQLYQTHGADLFRQHPITSVSLTDKEPSHESDGTFGWESAARNFSWGLKHRLPIVLLEALMRHPLCLATHGLRFATAVEALLAASEIAVNLGRKLNGFPPLPLTSRAPHKNPSA